MSQVPGPWPRAAAQAVAWSTWSTNILAHPTNKFTHLTGLQHRLLHTAQLVPQARALQWVGGSYIVCFVMPEVKGVVVEHEAQQRRGLWRRKKTMQTRATACGALSQILIRDIYMIYHTTDPQTMVRCTQGCSHLPARNELLQHAVTGHEQQHAVCRRCKKPGRAAGQVAQRVGRAVQLFIGTAVQSSWWAAGTRGKKVRVWDGACLRCLGRALPGTRPARLRTLYRKKGVQTGNKRCACEEEHFSEHRG